MAADLEQPTISNTHVNVLPQIVDNQTALARMFSDGGEANIPLRSVRFLNNAMYLWSGSVWDVAPIAVSGGGTGAQTAANARDNLGTSNAVNITQGTLDAARIPTLSITDKTSGTLGGTRVDQATTSVRGTAQLNNTLTSTSTTQALTAAQGKELKELTEAGTNRPTVYSVTTTIVGSIIFAQARSLTAASFPFKNFGDTFQTTADLYLAPCDAESAHNASFRIFQGLWVCLGFTSGSGGARGTLWQRIS